MATSHSLINVQLQISHNIMTNILSDTWWLYCDMQMVEKKIGYNWFSIYTYLEIRVKTHNTWLCLKLILQLFRWFWLSKFQLTLHSCGRICMALVTDLQWSSRTQGGSIELDKIACATANRWGKCAIQHSKYQDSMRSRHPFELRQSFDKDNMVAQESRKKWEESMTTSRGHGASVCCYFERLFHCSLLASFTAGIWHHSTVQKSAILNG